MDAAEAKVVANGLTRFGRDMQELDRRFDELYAKHPGQWAGLYDGKLEIAPSLQELLKKFDCPNQTAAKHLKLDGRPLIASR